MNILFGQVPEEFLEYGEYFVDPKSKQSFYYNLEVEDEQNGEGMLTLTDTSGRYLPFDFTQLEELIDVLSSIQEYREEKSDFIQRWKEIFGV